MSLESGYLGGFVTRSFRSLQFSLADEPIDQPPSMSCYKPHSTLRAFVSSWCWCCFGSLVPEKIADYDYTLAYVHYMRKRRFQGLTVRLSREGLAGRWISRFNSSSPASGSTKGSYKHEQSIEVVPGDSPLSDPAVEEDLHPNVMLRIRAPFGHATADEHTENTTANEDGRGEYAPLNDGRPGSSFVDVNIDADETTDSKLPRHDAPTAPPPPMRDDGFLNSRRHSVMSIALFVLSLLGWTIILGHECRVLDRIGFFEEIYCVYPSIRVSSFRSPVITVPGENRAYQRASYSSFLGVMAIVFPGMMTLPRSWSPFAQSFRKQEVCSWMTPDPLCCQREHYHNEHTEFESSTITEHI